MVRGRRVLGVALALGTSGAALGAAAGPAAAGTPVTTTATCSLVSFNGEPPRPQQRLRTTGLTPNRDYMAWVYADLDDGPFSIHIGWSSDGSGVLELPSFSDEPPVYFALTLYDDLNANGNWDRDVDRTYFRGEGTITACPQTVTLSPK